MLQFYFLSILLNLTAGLIFVYVSKNDSTSLALSEPDDFGLNPDSDDFSDTENSAPKSEKSSATGLGALAAPFLGDKTLQLVVGILSVLTGIMKLLSPIQFDVPLVGDLLPSLGGIASGFVLLLDWFQKRTDTEIALPELIHNLYTDGRKYLGIFCIITACLHFLFPRVLFL